MPEHSVLPVDVLPSDLLSQPVVLVPYRGPKMQGKAADADGRGA